MEHYIEKLCTVCGWILHHLNKGDLLQKEWELAEVLKLILLEYDINICLFFAALVFVP